MSYDGECLTDKDEKQLWLSPELKMADWRKEKFGVESNQELLNFIAHNHRMGSNYVTHDNPYFPEWKQQLPVGSERSWKRGTWVDVYYGDRETNLWIECQAYQHKKESNK